MRKLSTLFLTVVILLSIAGSALAEERASTVIELTEAQIAIIVHNCPQDGEITIELTDEQISIIIHDFPQVEIEELTLGREHLSRENTVELIPEGRSGVSPVEAR